jgi:multiple sugar transport system substrate-binding protein
MKKFLSLILALAMCLSLAACGGSSGSGTQTGTDSSANTNTGESTGEATEVTLWHYFDNETDLLEQMVEEYNEMQDEIHITATYMSRDELMNQYTVGALSGELPDIGMVDSPDMASYIELGVFEDITDQLNEWGELDSFYPGPLSSCQGSDGDYYGLPQNSNCLALACNMDLLAEAGYDHAPTSLDEFQEMAAGVTGVEEGVYGFAMCAVSTEEGTFQLLPWLRSDYNGQSVNVDDLTADSAVHGLTVLSDLVKNGYMSTECVNWTQSDALNEFLGQKAAMYEAGTWHLFNFNEENLSEKFNYEVVLLPTGDEGTSTSTIGGENFGVCSGAKNVDACVKFLEWFTSKENEEKWSAVAGKISVRSDAEPEYSYEQESFAVFQDEMNYALARGPHAEWPSISTAIYTAAQSTFVDGTDPATALATAMETIAPIVEANPLAES